MESFHHILVIIVNFMPLNSKFSFGQYKSNIY